MTCVTYKIDQKIDFPLRFILFLQGVANGEMAGEHVLNAESLRRCSSAVLTD